MKAGVSTSSTTGDKLDHGTHLQEETMITGRDILRDGVRVVDVEKERILHQGQPQLRDGCGSWSRMPA
jgi:hypothetical protein